MQKKLIVLALASAFAAPAFAATSNVDIYGFAAYSVDYINTHEALGDSKDMVTGRDNISRIGFKGSEDLGGGLSAIWQMENQLSSSVDGGGVPNAGAALAQRDTFVGLSSASLGTVVIGRHDTPYKMATAKLDPFADQLGDYNAIIGSAGGLNAGAVGVLGTGFDIRAPGTIAYVSPDLSGLTLVGAYIEVKANEGSPSKNTNGYSLAAMYSNGPIFASGAYERHNGALAITNLDSDTSAWKLGLGGSLADFTAGVVYEQMKDSAGNTQFDRKAWLVNGTYTLGSAVLKAEYGKADNSKAVSNDGAKFWAVGGDYNFSKRTKVFAQYAAVNNDNNGSYSFYSYPTAASGGLGSGNIGDDVSGFSVGIKHSF